MGDRTNLIRSVSRESTFATFSMDGLESVAIFVDRLVECDGSEAVLDVDVDVDVVQ